jgi:hypothetical protein
MLVGVEDNAVSVVAVWDFGVAGDSFCATQAAFDILVLIGSVGVGEEAKPEGFLLSSIINLRGADCAVGGAALRIPLCTIHHQLQQSASEAQQEVQKKFRRRGGCCARFVYMYIGIHHCVLSIINFNNQRGVAGSAEEIHIQNAGGVLCYVYIGEYHRVLL